MTLKSIMELGVQKNNSAILNEKIKLTNALCIFSLPIGLVVILIGIIIIDYGTIFSFLVTTAFVGLVPFINGNNRYNLSRLVLSIVPAILMIAFTMLGSLIYINHIVVYSYAIIAVGLFPAILFDINTEKHFLYPLVLLQMVFILCFDQIMLLNANVEAEHVFGKMYVHLKLGQAVFYAFIVGVVLLVLNVKQIKE